MTHQLIADMTGVTRESATKIMKTLYQKINQNKLQQKIL
jgi:CRP-like cAMP-binding protein